MPLTQSRSIVGLEQSVFLDTLLDTPAHYVRNVPECQSNRTYFQFVAFFFLTPPPAPQPLRSADGEHDPPGALPHSLGFQRDIFRRPALPLAHPRGQPLTLTHQRGPALTLPHG